MSEFISTAAARKAVSHALATGALYDVTGAASAFLPVPVFITGGVWNRVIVPDEGVRSIFQHEDSRVERVIEGLDRAVRRAIRRDARLAPSFAFNVTLRMERYPRWTTLPLLATTAHAEGGFCACIVVTMPDEA